MYHVEPSTMFFSAYSVWHNGEFMGEFVSFEDVLSFILRDDEN